jgi:hypothetical protein
VASTTVKSKPPGYLRLRWIWQFLVRSEMTVPGPIYVWKPSKPKVTTYFSSELGLALVRMPDMICISLTVLSVEMLVLKEP